MEELVRILRDGGHSLVVDNGTRRTFDGRGVADLYGLLMGEPGALRGASVADKVVGKGAAALMIAGGVGKLYAEVVSTPALELLRTAGVEVRFGREVPHIINRRKDGICPVETLCLPCRTAAECLPRIAAFMAGQTDKTDKTGETQQTGGDQR